MNQNTILAKDFYLQELTYNETLNINGGLVEDPTKGKGGIYTACYRLTSVAASAVGAFIKLASYMGDQGV